MDKTGKKQPKKKKKWIIITAVAAVGILLAVFLLPQFFFRSVAGNAVAAAATRTVTVERGTIETTVTGSGNLSAESTLNISLPSSVTVESVLVEAGDSVSEGDILATLNAVSLQSAISNLQSELDALDSELGDISTDEESYSVEASVNGRVKQIYASAGDDSGEVLGENGALAILSLDGKMKVLFTPSSTDGITVGSEAEITLSDGSTVTGTVAALSADTCTVTLTDDGPAYGDTVSISVNGTALGSGTLEVNAPISILGGTGTIESVEVSLNEMVDSGDALFTVSGAVSQEYAALLSERAEYADTLRALLKYAQTNSTTADASGTIVEAVSSVSSSSVTQSSETSAQIMSTTVAGNSASLLSSGSGMADTPVLLSGTDHTATDISGTVQVYINNPVTGDTPQSTIMPGSGYTGTITWQPSASKFESGTVYTANVVLTAQDGYRFSEDATASVTGATVENVMVSAESETNTLSFSAVFPATQATGDASEPEPSNDGAQDSHLPNTENDISVHGNGAGTSFPSGTAASVGSGSASSSVSTADSTSSDSSLSMQTIITIQTGEANSLTVNVDELDILSIEEGQEVSVVLDALPDDTFHGTVTKVSGSGTAQSGVTTYPVTITLDDAADSGVLSGMNATATISVARSENVLLIPLDALQERGAEQFVYIAGDGDGDNEQRAVETGLSDGTNVEILSGLSEGEQIVYTESISNQTDEQNAMPDIGGGSFPGGMGGNMDMGSFTPPSGDMGGGPMG